MDVDGQVHKYTIVQHPATAGLHLFQRLLGQVAHPAGAILASFQAGAELPEELTAEGLMNFVLDDGLDGEKIGVAIDIFVQKIGMNMDLFDQVLQYVERDGEELTKGHFDHAYQGNYAELFAAVAWAIKVNFASMLRAQKFPFAQGSRSALKDNDDSKKSTRKATS